MRSPENQNQRGDVISAPEPSGGPLRVSELWQILGELECGTLGPEQLDHLNDLLRRSPAARRAYLEFFQHSSVLRVEAAKLKAQGLMPVVGAATRRRRIFRRSLLVAAALVAVGAVIAGWIAVVRPDPEKLAARVSPQTQWE